MRSEKAELGGASGRRCGTAYTAGTLPVQTMIWLLISRRTLAHPLAPITTKFMLGNGPAHVSGHAECGLKLTEGVVGDLTSTTVTEMTAGVCQMGARAGAGGRISGGCALSHKPCTCRPQNLRAACTLEVRAKITP